MHGLRVSLLSVTCVLVVLDPSFPLVADEAPPSDEQIRFFENRIRPLLATRCYECHSNEENAAEGGLVLDSRAGWVRGGDRGPVLVPGRPEASRLIEAVGYENVDLQMPPDGKLSDREIEQLTRWVRMGAPDPRTAPPTPISVVAEFDLEKRRREHWSWQPLGQSPAPSTIDRDWPRSDIDRHILHRLETAGLHPAPPADKRTYIRRVTFDLLGLPPSPNEIETFLADDSPEAFPRLVDRLLASPHFGERWGQHWLDLMRFAETRGHEQDFPIPEAYRYRDYVIRAFNQDVPYDQLVTEHVAGDLLDPPRLDPTDHTNQSIQGTGFWHLGEATHSPVDIRGDEADRVHNQIDVFSRTFLGLSVGCARCHDHKFDAISTRDYYALFGYLQSSSFQLADVSNPVQQRHVADRLGSLVSQHQPAIVAAFVDLKRHQLDRLPEYLSAAFEAIRTTRSSGAEDGLASKSTLPGNQLQVSTGHRRPLDQETLERVVEHLQRAASDIHDPLHLFARLTRLGGVPCPTDVREVKRDLLEQWMELERLSRQRHDDMKVIKSTKSGERNYTTHERDWSARDVVEDFRDDAADRWIVSGHRFGSGPYHPGDLLLGTRPRRPIERVLDAHAAESDMRSKQLSGMLRTRTFEIVGDTLWYRCRGSADVFLAVDSHRVVHGPLHGIVQQPLKGDPNRWKWHSHFVRDYVGHRVHVEFTPRDGFALDRIQFAAEPPPDRFQIHPRLRDLLQRSPSEVEAVMSVGNDCRDYLWGAMESLADREVDAADARLLNWLIEHPHLFEPVPRLAHALEDRFRAFARARSQAETAIPAPIRALALLDGSGEDEPIHIRGSHRNLGPEPIPRAILTALGGAEQPRPTAGSGRLALARRLADPANPLVPRVIVNRIWHHLFGRGIVPTVDDFGAMGKPPTHPELLDHLARRFIANQWSIKKTIREIVLSSTYRMSSRGDEQHERIDPANQLYHRMPIRRLPAESVRDLVLSVSGRLDPTLYGPSVMVHITPFMRGNRSPKGSGPLDGAGRRSIYLEVRRNHLPAMLVAFDKPIPFTAIGRRTVSNSPAQPLILLNDPFVHQQAEVWARRTLAAGDDDRERFNDAYLRAFGRPPSTDEISTLIGFLDQQAKQYQAMSETEPRLKAWIDLCHTLMNVKEFIYIN